MPTTTVETISVELEGVDQVLSQLSQYRGRLEDWRPAWEKVLLYMRQVMIQHFESQGSRAGSPWQPLSEQYAREKQTSHPNMPILRRDDTMYQSLIGDTEFSFIEKEPLTFAFGTTDFKAPIHQYGKGRVPVREVLALTDDDAEKIRQFVFDHINGGGAFNLASALGPE